MVSVQRVRSRVSHFFINTDGGELFLQCDQLTGSLGDRLVELDEGGSELLCLFRSGWRFLVDSLYRSAEADRERDSFLVCPQLLSNEALNQIGKWDSWLRHRLVLLRLLNPLALQAELSECLLLAHDFGLPLTLEFSNEIRGFVRRVLRLLIFGPESSDLFRLEAALFLLSVGQTRPGVLGLLFGHANVGLGRNQLDVLAEEVQRAQLLALLAGDDGVVSVAQIVKADFELGLRLLW